MTKSFLHSVVGVLVILLTPILLFSTNQPPPSPPSNPFDGGKVNFPIGGGDSCFDGSYNANISIILRSIPVDSFPCDLHIKICRNELCEYVRVDPSLMVQGYIIDSISLDTIYVDHYLFEDSFDFEPFLTDEEKKEAECDGSNDPITLDVELVCFDGFKYNSIDYCSDPALWNPYFEIDCNQIPVPNTVSGTRTFKRCCGSASTNRSSKSDVSDVNIVLPGNAYLNYKLPKDVTDGELYITSLSGQKLYSQFLDFDENNHIEIGSLEYRGICFVTIVSKDALITKKVYLNN